MGETKGRREQMDKFVKRMVKEGYSPKYIKTKARECAIRADRNDSKQGK